MPHTVLTTSSPLNCLAVVTVQFWASNGVGQCWAQTGYCAFSTLCWMDETRHSQLGHLHKAPARPWHCRAAQLRSAGSAGSSKVWTVHRLCAWVQKPPEIYTYFDLHLFPVNTPPHREAHTAISVQHHMERMWKDNWFLPDLWGAAIRKQQFKMEGVSTSVSATASSVPARQGDACLQS